MTLDQLYDHALQFWGRDYLYGGDGSAHYGGAVDCSGLIQLILEPTGLDPKGDQSADCLYRYFLEEKRATINMGGLGSLAFFGNAKRVVHVGFCLDKRLMLNASGGDSKTVSIEIARAKNACVKIEPIRRRHDLVAIIMPNYSSRGIF